MAVIVIAVNAQGLADDRVGVLMDGLQHDGRP
jgi:hypothetical protein